MSTDHPNSERAARITAAVERETARRTRALWLYLFLLGIPIATAGYFGVYGYRDRELVNSTVQNQVRPIAEGIVREEVNNQISPLVQREVNAKVDPLAANIQDQLRETNSAQFAQLQQTLTSTQQQFADGLQEDVKNIRTEIDRLDTVGASVHEQIDKVNQRIRQMDSDPNVAKTADALRAINEKIRTLENDRTAFQAGLERLAQSQKLRVAGVYGELQVVGGQTTNVRVKLSQPAPETLVNLQIRADDAWFVTDGQRSQSIRQLARGDTVTVEIGAAPVEKTTRVALVVGLTDQPPEEVSLRISPAASGVDGLNNEELQDLRRQIDALRERVMALSESNGSRIMGNQVWEVVGGQTAKVEVKFNRPVPRGTVLNLELRDERASFLREERPVQDIRQPVSGESTTVVIRAARVGRPVTVEISAQLNDQPPEKIGLRILPR